MSNVSLVSEVQPPKPRTLTDRLKFAYDHWVSRSLMVGAAATAIDIVILLICVKGFGMPNPAGAMVGVVVGSTFTFFANRHFAFRDHKPQLAPQAVKFVLTTFLAMLLHAYVVHLLADRMGLNVVLAKMTADVAVFTVGQLLVLRYIVFPKLKPQDLPAAEPVIQLLETAHVAATVEEPVRSAQQRA